LGSSPLCPARDASIAVDRIRIAEVSYRRTPISPDARLDWKLKLQIRMVAGFAEIAEKERFLVAGVRYVPNRQFLNMPFCSVLVQHVEEG
jgi:hypothetical protein